MSARLGSPPSGFHATPMRDLCGALGMSAGNLYHWFPSKQAIIAAFVAADSAEIAARFAEISQAKDLTAGPAGSAEAIRPPQRYGLNAGP